MTYKHTTRLRRILTPAAVAICLLVPQTVLAADHDADIVDTAIAAGSFKTLVAAVQAAGLVDTLKSEGPFTVFAPTDEAFAKLPKGTLESLLQPENRDALTRILTYHVVAGEVTARNAAGLDRAKTVSKERVAIAIEGGQLRINDARVVDNDIRTSNGIIHVIDTVLLPDGIGDQLAEAQGRKVIGVYVSRPDRALAAQLGIDRHDSLLVTGLTRSGGALEAGLEKYDVITAINGHPANSASLRQAKDETRVGDEIDLEILRRGRGLDISVPVGVARH